MTENPHDSINSAGGADVGMYMAFSSEYISVVSTSLHTPSTQAKAERIRENEIRETTKAFQTLSARQLSGSFVSKYVD